MRYANAGAGAAQRVLAVGVVAVLLTVTGWAAAAEADTDAQAARESAVWTPKELTFMYQGFTTTYSCEGLRDKVRSILLELGAREDLKVTETGCSSLGGPDPFPGVRIKMNVLQPAADKNATAGRNRCHRTGKWSTSHPSATRSRQPESASSSSRSSRAFCRCSRPAMSSTARTACPINCRSGRLGCERKCWFPTRRVASLPDPGEVRASGLDGRLARLEHR